MDIKKTLGKPIINAGVAGTALHLLTNGAKFDYGGTTYPIFKVGAVIGLGSSFAVEAFSNLVLPHIPGNAKYQHLESMVLHLGSSAGVFMAVPKILNGSLNMREAQLFGAAGLISELVSQKVYEAYLAVDEAF